MCVKNYEIISDFKAAIISAFEEASDAMVTSNMENFGRRLDTVLQNKGGYYEK